MPVSLYNPFAAVGASNPFSGANGTQGNLFHVGVDCHALSVDIWAAGGAPNANIDVGIYDHTASTWVWSPGSPTWALTPAGWAVNVIDTTVDLLAGHQYGVYAYYPAGVTWFYDNGKPGTGYGLFWDPTSNTGGAAEVAATDLAHPTTGTVNGRTHPIGVTTDLDGTLTGGDASGGGISPSEVSDELAKWLSSTSGTNLHHDDLPWTTAANVVTALARLDSITTGDVTTYGLRSQDIAAAVIKALAFLVTNADKLDLIKSWFTGTRNPLTSDAVDVILNRIDLQTGNGQVESQWTSGQVLGAAHHTEVDSLPFTGQVGWGSGYALHRIHIDSSDAQHPMIDLGAAGFWVPGFGWWAATLPDGSLTNRHPVEFSDQWLWPVPAAATGLILWCHPSSTGTLYAYSTL